MTKTSTTNNIWFIVTYVEDDNNLLQQSTISTTPAPQFPMTSKRNDNLTAPLSEPHIQKVGHSHTNTQIK